MPWSECGENAGSTECRFSTEALRGAEMESAEGRHKRRETRIAEEEKTKMPRETAVGVFREFGSQAWKKRLRRKIARNKIFSRYLCPLFLDLHNNKL